jgi:DNA-binding transcriptional MerR regulator
MAIQSAQSRRSAPSEIPDKLYFRIGDVARICAVPAYVLRFWESEFPQLKPNKGGTGQRLYRKRDVELALRIKRLLYDEGYTIPGARQVFQAEAKDLRKKSAGPELPLPVASSPAAEAALQKARKELRELAAMLASPAGTTSSHRPIKASRPRESPSDSGGLFGL